MNCYAVFILFFSSFYFVSGQGNSNHFEEGVHHINFTDTGLNQQVLADSLWLWQERVDLQIDRPVVRPEEVLFFKANILTGPNQYRVSASEVLRLELLDGDGKLLKKQVHRITEGSSSGSLELPKKMDAGIYYLRAYTRWMLNYGLNHLPTKKILVKDRKDDFFKETNEDLVVVPEGGFLVSGLQTKVIVSSGTLNLEAIPVVNQKGEIVANINTYGRGLGAFQLTPVWGDTYAVRIADDRLVPLPEVLEKGYNMQVNNLAPEKMIVQITGSGPSGKSSLYLLGKSGGATYVDKEVAFDDDLVARIEIPKSDIPEGIFHLQLRDGSGRAWSYRPVVVEKNELQIQAEKSFDSEGTEILKIRVTDRDNEPVETTLSLSLTGEVLTNRSGGRLPFDLPARILDRSTAFVNDLKILSGEQQISTGLLKRSAVPERIKYDFQKGVDFYGQAYNLYNELLRDTDIQILIEEGDNVYVREVRTDDDGRFQLSDLDISGEATLVFRTAGEETEAKLVKVIPFEFETPPLIIPEVYKGTLIPEETLNSSTEFMGNREENEQIIALNTVTLIATRELKKSNIPDYALQATRVISQERERPVPIDQLFLNIPGVQVVGLGTPYPYLSIPRAAGLGPLLWVLDGFIMNQSTTLVDIISLVPYTDVESIEILIGAEASIYGTRSAGGVISIKTRSGSDVDYLARKDAQAVLHGYHESPSFKEISGGERSRRKGRIALTTLFWDPVLKTDKNGEVIIPLPGAEEFDLIRMEARIFTQDGKQGNIESFFTKNN